MSTNQEINGIITELLQLVNTWEQRLLNLPEPLITRLKNRQDRSIKQLIGHLIDSASNNHQRIVRLQYVENELRFPDYTSHNDTWIKIQHYQDEDWNTIVGLWKFYNLHLVHLMKHIKESKLQHYWIDEDGAKVELFTLLKGYLWHLNLHIGEIQELLDEIGFVDNSSFTE